MVTSWPTGPCAYAGGSLPPAGLGISFSFNGSSFGGSGFLGGGGGGVGGGASFFGGGGGGVFLITIGSGALVTFC